ncbi:MAG TPA: methyltransferase domain-containing protein [Nocardioidaceae bacterium]|nr:methyltransferase domain-containing protein [Nocardioidaceae bacterium]
MSDDAGVRFWDGEADRFDDAVDHGLRDPVARDRWRALLRTAIARPASRIADLGCGTGTLSVLLAELGHRVHGVDFSPRMVELARAKAVAADVAVRPTFVVGNAADPPLVAGGFDVVLSRHVLWAMPDVGQALDRWLALLARGGALVLVEGRWWTGGGLAAGDAVRFLSERGRAAVVSPLPDPALWGGPMSDERYLLISAR